MIDPTRGNPEQALRLFFSMDLAGASKYKYAHPPPSLFDANVEQNARVAGSWPAFFIEFFNKAGRTFWKHMQTSSDAHGHGLYPIEFWKTLGDEILFFSTQTSEEQPYWQLRTFLETVQDLHAIVQENTNLQLGVKGVVWSAGFPIRNKRIFLDQSNGASVYEGDEESLSETTGAKPTPGAVVDFMGLEMDQGFRLGSHATPGRVVISPDACYLAAKAFPQIDARFGHAAAAYGHTGLVDARPEFRVVQVGWECLRGVLGDLPVPILWPECARRDRESLDNRSTPFAFDAGRSRFWAQYLTAPAMSARDYRDFFERWSIDLGKHGVSHIRPYVLPNASMDPGHQRQWAQTPQGKTVKKTILNLGDQQA